jgi:hypothetical protein
MSAETPDEEIPQEPAIPGSKEAREVPEQSSPVEPPPPDGSERPAAREEPDQEGQRAFGEPGDPEPEDIS